MCQPTAISTLESRVLGEARSRRSGRGRVHIHETTAMPHPQCDVVAEVVWIFARHRGLDLGDLAAQPTSDSKGPIVVGWYKKAALPAADRPNRHTCHFGWLTPMLPLPT